MSSRFSHVTFGEKQLDMAKQSPDNQSAEDLSLKLAKMEEEYNNLTELLSQTKAALNQGDEKKRPNYDSPIFDPVLNKQISDSAILKGITSQVYCGRVVSIIIRADGQITVAQQAHHLAKAETKDQPYRPLVVTLSVDSFILLLDALKFAEEKFGLNRIASIDRLTNGDSDVLHFNETITII